uniref:Uncharacterized protein n=1 Tax=Oryza glumipatula TaxID=40148 RepID=A0A0D9YLR4_9ORYZ
MTAPAVAGTAWAWTEAVVEPTDLAWVRPNLGLARVAPAIHRIKREGMVMLASEKGNSTTAGGDPTATGGDATGGDPTVTGSRIHHSREGTQMRVVVVGSVLSLPVAVRRERRSLELPVAVELGDVATVSPSSFPPVGPVARDVVVKPGDLFRISSARRGWMRWEKGRGRSVLLRAEALTGRWVLSPAADDYWYELRGLSHAAALTLVSFVPDSPLPSAAPFTLRVQPATKTAPPFQRIFMLRVAMGRPRHEDRLLFVGIVGAKISASGNPPASSSGQRYLRGTEGFYEDVNDRELGLNLKPQAWKGFLAQLRH